MATKLHQANVNHSAGAQDLLLQVLAERNGGLALVSEPHHIPERDSSWLGLRHEFQGAAIYWRPKEASLRLKLIRAEKYIVAVEWDAMRVASVYAPPRSGVWSRARFGVFLEQVGRVLDMYAAHPVIVAGDFNSLPREWGSRRTEPGGQDLLEWAATRGLILINSGSVSTCVRAQGESIVDLTFGNRPAVRAVKRWRVATKTDINSDHLLIELSVVATPTEVLRRRREGAELRPPRWALRRLDEVSFKMSVIASSWAGRVESPPLLAREDIEEETAGLGEVMEAACDSSMPRARPTPRAVYWWCEEVAELLGSVILLRRRVQRMRAVRRKGLEWELARRSLRAARIDLRKAIVRAKAQAWQRLLEELDRDPWGRPYRIVLGRLRTWASPATENLDPQALDNVVGALFPTAGPEPLPYEGPHLDRRRAWRSLSRSSQSLPKGSGANLKPLGRMVCLAGHGPWP
ncbi:uncharacterized protein LOC116850722 [Odontomachus brunneus]|uniref:uncharacterized protein LOC116850722 n=1 Tax=Odontomachus brunneus TaxID=486640 RepID=UPI0013F23502|nr:uncharacterized protein LOC116850722 [Odontomachus brunneus]